MTIAYYLPLAIEKNAFELFFQVSAACKPFFFFFSIQEREKRNYNIRNKIKDEQLK
jgi:hypothetical protein